MSEKIIAARYAKALMTLSDSDKQKEEGVIRALEALNSLFLIEEAEKVLSSLVMPSDLKLSLLKAALSKAEPNKEMEAFASVLVEQKRVNVIPAIVEEFNKLLDEKNGISRATITSAFEISAEELELIKKTLESLYNKDIEIEKNVDGSLLGGLVIRIGHTLIDLSLKTKLDALTNSASN